MTAMKVIITDCDHTSISIEDAVLKNAGIEYRLLQCRTEQDVIDQCRGAEIFINQYAPITRRVMTALRDLKLVIRYGVGYDNIDIEAATSLGVQICNIPDYGVNEVAAHAFALMMALTRKIVYINEITKTTDWNYTHAIPIQRFSAMTVGVVGLGRIGRTFAGLAAGLGCRIVGTDPFYTPNEADGTAYIHPLSFDELVRCSDVISIHCHCTDETRNMFCSKVFKAMKNSAVLINVSRGGLVNEPDLDMALETGEIAGAGLDCMAVEPTPPGARILRHKNLICTPHMAWYSEQASEDLKRKAAEQAVLFASGRDIQYPVNKVK